MSLQTILKICLVTAMTFTSCFAVAHSHSSPRAKWMDISDDKKPFDKNCDYKVWVMEDGDWSETWYLEAFDSENAFYTIDRNSSSWADEDAFYALNHKDKTKFLIGENYIEVVTFSLCLNK